MASGDQEGPSILSQDGISRGRYYLPLASGANYAVPMKTLGTLTDSKPQKLNCAPYTDTTSVETCIGLHLYEIIAKPDSNDDQAIYLSKWRQRDTAIVYKGRAKLKNMKSGYTGAENDKVAPYPGGFTEWSSGMSVLGYLQEPTPYNKYGEIEFLCGRDA